MPRTLMGAPSGINVWPRLWIAFAAALLVTAVPIFLHIISQPLALLFCVAIAMFAARFMEGDLPLIVLVRNIFQNTFAALASWNFEIIGRLQVDAHAVAEREKHVDGPIHIVQRGRNGRRPGEGRESMVGHNRQADMTHAEFAQASQRRLTRRGIRAQGRLIREIEPPPQPFRQEGGARDGALYGGEARKDRGD
jgi:hypothetical protein